MRLVILLCAELGYTLFALSAELGYTLSRHPRGVLDRGTRGAFCVGFARRARRVGLARRARRIGLARRARRVGLARRARRIGFARRARRVEFAGRWASACLSLLQGCLFSGRLAWCS
jgi:hypothetical protein